MKNRRRPSPGFTLIEIILALLVISIGIVSVVGVLGSSVDSSAKSQQDILAVTFADMILNYCHAAGFEAVPTEGALPIVNTAGENETLPCGTVSLYSGRLPAAQNGTDQEFTLSYLLNVTENSDVKTVQLDVWPGINAEAAEPIRFYTELYNWNQSR